MAAVYPKFKEAALSGNGNVLSGDVRAILLDLGAYTYSAAHEFLASVPAGARVAVSPSLAGRSVGDGVFDASDLTVPNVSGATIEGLILYVHTGDDATARLVSYHDKDVDGVTPISYAPIGNDVLITWPNDAGRIFTL